jgi:hypothetical protein
MNLGNIMLGEAIQSQKDKCCMIALTCIYKIVKLKAKNTIVAVRS